MTHPTAILEIKLTRFRPRGDSRLYCQECILRQLQYHTPRTQLGGFPPSNPQDDAISLHPFPQKCCERYAANPTPCQLSAHFPVANRSLICGVESNTDYAHSSP